MKKFYIMSIKDTTQLVNWCVGGGRWELYKDEAATFDKEVCDFLLTIDTMPGWRDYPVEANQNETV